MYLVNFYTDIIDIYGLYLHSRMGLKSFCDKHKTEAKVTPQNRFSFADSVKEIENGKFLYSCTFEEIYELNSPTGLNMRLLSNMVVVNIYQLWEDYYREPISKELGFKTKSDLKINLFGEINILRQSIIHNNGLIISKLKKLNILTYKDFEGYLLLDFQDIKLFIEKLKLELLDIEQQIKNKEKLA